MTNEQIMDFCREACRNWADDQLGHSEMWLLGHRGYTAAPHVLFTELLDALRDLYEAIETEEAGWFEEGALEADRAGLEGLVAGIWDMVMA